MCITTGNTEAVYNIIHTAVYILWSFLCSLLVCEPELACSCMVVSWKPCGSAFGRVYFSHPLSLWLCLCSSPLSLIYSITHCPLIRMDSHQCYVYNACACVCLCGTLFPTYFLLKRIMNNTIPRCNKCLWSCHNNSKWLLSQLRLLLSGSIPWNTVVADTLARGMILKPLSVRYSQSVSLYSTN